MTRRRAARLLLLLLAAALTTLALGAPRFTWENDGVHVEHPPDQALAALAAALALGGATLGVRPRALSVAGIVGALSLAGLSAERLAWRVDAVAAGIQERTLGGVVQLGWKDVERVEPRSDAVTLRGRDGTTLAIVTRRFGADERTRLERTIARRVREAAR